MTDNLPEKKQMSWVLENGDEVTLAVQQVIDFCVSGRKELVTAQEVALFMHTCKQYRMNPFTRDCYLIKYSEKENAAVVQSIHNKRARAMQHPRCAGWQKGIVVMHEDGQRINTNGLLPEHCRLIGGWFKGYVVDWLEPYTHEVNLEAYIQYTFKNGKRVPNHFWRPENQAHQIMKVAESQGITALWGDRCIRYIPEEYGSGSDEDVDVAPNEENEGHEAGHEDGDTYEASYTDVPEDDTPPETVVTPADKFDMAVENKIADMEPEGQKIVRKWIPKYVDYCVEHSDYPDADTVRGLAVQGFDSFFKMFYTGWLPKQAGVLDQAGDNQKPKEPEVPPTLKQKDKFEAALDQLKGCRKTGLDNFLVKQGGIDMLKDPDCPRQLIGVCITKWAQYHPGEDIPWETPVKKEAPPPQQEPESKNEEQAPATFRGHMEERVDNMTSHGLQAAMLNAGVDGEPPDWSDADMKDVIDEYEKLPANFK